MAGVDVIGGVEDRRPIGDAASAVVDTCTHWTAIAQEVLDTILRAKAQGKVLAHVKGHGKIGGFLSFEIETDIQLDYP